MENKYAYPIEVWAEIFTFFRQIADVRINYEV
jgi:hypothetical protein